MRATSPWRNAWIFVVGLGIVALDQWTKALVRQQLPPNASWNPIAWLEPFVTLTYVRNTGIAFGLFQGMGVFSVVVAVGVLVAVAVFFRQLCASSWVLRLALGFMLGGTIGNQIDRLTRGYVTDFIDVRVWPIFNVADSSVVIATTLLAIYALFIDRPASVPQPAPEQGTRPDEAPGPGAG